MIEVVESLLTTQRLWKEISKCLPYRLQPKHYSSLLTRLGFRAFLLPIKNVAGNLENSIHSQENLLVIKQLEAWQVVLPNEEISKLT